MTMLVDAFYGSMRKMARRRNEWSTIGWFLPCNWIWRLLWRVWTRDNFIWGWSLGMNIDIIHGLWLMWFSMVEIEEKIYLSPNLPKFLLMNIPWSSIAREGGNEGSPSDIFLIWRHHSFPYGSLWPNSKTISIDKENGYWCILCHSIHIPELYDLRQISTAGRVYKTSLWVFTLTLKWKSIFYVGSIEVVQNSVLRTVKSQGDQIKSWKTTVSCYTSL